MDGPPNPRSTRSRRGWYTALSVVTVAVASAAVMVGPLSPVAYGICMVLLAFGLAVAYEQPWAVRFAARLQAREDRARQRPRSTRPWWQGALIIASLIVVVAITIALTGSDNG